MAGPRSKKIKHQYSHVVWYVHVLSHIRKKAADLVCKYSTYVHTKVCIQYAANIYLSSCLLSVCCLFIVCLLSVACCSWWCCCCCYCCCWWRWWCRCCWWGAYTTRSKSECYLRLLNLSGCLGSRMETTHLHIFFEFRANSDKWGSLHCIHFILLFTFMFHQWRYRASATGDFHDNPAENSYNNHPWIHRFFSGEFLCFSIPHLGLEDWEFLSSAFFVAKAPPRCLLPQPASWEAVLWCPMLTKISNHKTALVRIFFRKYILISATALAHIDLYMYAYTYNMCVCVFVCTYAPPPPPPPPPPIAKQALPTNTHHANALNSNRDTSYNALRQQSRILGMNLCTSKLIPWENRIIIIIIILARVPARFHPKSSS